MFVFTNDCSGIGSVYYKDLHEKTLHNLKNGAWDWKFKWELMEKVFSEDALRNTKYLENFNKAYNYITNLWEGTDSLTISKSQAKELFRDIDAVQVIPKKFEEEVKGLLQKWEDAKGNLAERVKLLSQILEYSFSLPVWSLKELEKQRIHDRLSIYYVEGNYSEDIGFELISSADTEWNVR